MQQIKDGDKRMIGTKLDGDIVTVNHVTLNKPTQQKYQLEWRFDFTDVSVDDLKRLATRGLVIDQRPKFKDEKDVSKLKAWDNKTFSVKALLAKERKRTTVEEKAEKALSDLSAEAQLELLKKLLAGKGVDVTTLEQQNEAGENEEEE